MLLHSKRILTLPRRVVFCAIGQGKGCKKSAAEQLCAELEEQYEELEVSLKKGGQPLYYYIISLE